MTHNDDWLQRSRNVVWHPATQMKNLQSLELLSGEHRADGEQMPLIPIARGEGCWLFDFDDNRYLDAISSWWVNLFGHANAQIIAAIEAQMKQLEHVMLAGFTHAPVVRLSERLIALAPDGLRHCAYASDGASAVEMALKMSYQSFLLAGQPDKKHFLCLQNSYHGETLGALGVTDVPLFQESFRPLIHQAFTVRAPDSRQTDDGVDNVEAAIADLERVLNEHHHQLAAFIVEPLVQGAGGMVFSSPDYLTRARQLCDQYHVHLIADEIAVGFGRTGTMFACEQAGITPDFLCLSKGITGGFLPLSVVLTTDAIYDQFYDDSIQKAFWHSHSYTGNPLCCAAANAVLDIFQEEAVLARNRERGALLHQQLDRIREYPGVTHPRQCGMIVAFEFRSAKLQSARHFYREALNHNVLLRPLGETIYWMPPYCIDSDEIEFLGESTRATLECFLS